MCTKSGKSLMPFAESLASFYQKSRPKASARGSKRNKRRTDASSAAVSSSIPQEPQLGVVAQPSKEKPGTAKAPPVAVLVALNPLPAQSMPHGKKRKELASEADVDSHDDRANVEC